MRESLRQSLADSPARGFERYPSGSIVLCNACAAPIYRLDGAIGLGDKASRMAERFKPLRLADLAELAGRVDVDAGVRAKIQSWTLAERQAHLEKLHEFRTGDPMICPACRGCFVQVLTVEKSETHDRAYTIELLTVPPYGTTPSPIRGKHFNGPDGDWIHERRH